jgi:hypothetical protein
MGNTIDEYCSDEYDEYEEDEVEEDDYDEEEDEATLIPRISVTIIPKNKNDMSLLTKHIEDVCQDTNSVNALETCVAGR